MMKSLYIEFKEIESVKVNLSFECIQPQISLLVFFPLATLVLILECLVKEFYFSGEAYGRLYEILVFLWF